MAIISSSWVFETNGCLFCYWPSYFRTDLLRDKAVQCHILLQEDKCVKCPILIKFSTDDYLKARSKLQRLEIESQTESEMEEAENKRKPKKKNFYDYESDDSELDIPQVSLPKKILSNLENLQKFQKSSVSCGGNVSQSTPKTTKSGLSQKCTSSLTYNTRIQERPIIEDPSDELSTTSSEKLSSRSCTGCDENKKLLTEVLRQLRIVKDDTNHLIRLVVNKEEKQAATGEVEKIDNFDELLKLNNDLSDKTIFAEMCCKLQYIGGKDDLETCRKILSNLITNELAIKTNWTGRNDKNGFKDLKNLIQLIHVSVRKNPLSKDCTMNDIETTIKSWLRTAVDREGGRAKRNAQKQVS